MGKDQELESPIRFAEKGVAELMRYLWVRLRPHEFCVGCRSRIQQRQFSQISEKSGVLEDWYRARPRWCAVGTEAGNETWTVRCDWGLGSSCLPRFEVFAFLDSLPFSSFATATLCGWGSPFSHPAIGRRASTFPIMIGTRLMKIHDVAIESFWGLASRHCLRGMQTPDATYPFDSGAVRFGAARQNI